MHDNSNSLITLINPLAPPLKKKKRRRRKKEREKMKQKVLSFGDYLTDDFDLLHLENFNGMNSFIPVWAMMIKFQGHLSVRKMKLLVMCFPDDLTFTQLHFENVQSYT